MIVVISAAAEEDLSALWYWIGEDNPARADTFLDELEARIAGLDHWAERYPVAFESSDGPVRRLVHRGYRILYRIVDDQVDVLCVHHGRRPPPQFS